MLSSSFKDITSDRWSANAIERVAQLNIISGYGDNTYRPEQFMSRQEFAVVADNYIHYLGYNTDDQAAMEAVHYTDQKFIAPWAQSAVRELAALGFLHYQPRLLFSPENTLPVPRQRKLCIALQTVVLPWPYAKNLTPTGRE